MDRHAPRPIPDSYWVDLPAAPGHGRLLAGEYPGHSDEAAAARRLGRLLDAGVTEFIDLTQAGEGGLRPYAEQARQLGAERGLAVRHRRHAIPDLGTPPPAQMRRTLAAIDQALAAGRTVYLHCWGGIGRTGTVVGCYLVEHGLTGDEALAAIARMRAGTPKGTLASPETAGQEALIREWKLEPEG